LEKRIALCLCREQLQAHGFLDGQPAPRHVYAWPLHTLTNRRAFTPLARALASVACRVMVSSIVQSRGCVRLAISPAQCTHLPCLCSVSALHVEHFACIKPMPPAKFM